MTWLPWMTAEPSDAWFSESQLAEQRAAEEGEREFRVMLRRRREFELTVALLDEPTDAELREAWLRADRVARGVGSG